MDEIEIRDYREEDYAELKNLWELTGLGSPERGDDQQTIERCIAHGGRLLLMIKCETEKLIGTSWMTFDGRRILLHHFGIHPDYQGRGYGKKLGLASLEHIRSTGYQVKLEVHRDNKRAVALYKSLGFFSFRDYDIMMIRKFDESGNTADSGKVWEPT